MSASAEKSRASPSDREVRDLLNGGRTITAIAAVTSARITDVRRIIRKSNLVRGQLDLFADWPAARRREPAQAWAARKRMLDRQIHELLSDGLNTPQVAKQLEIHPYQVQEAKKRLGLIKKQELYEVEIEDVRPKRLYKCPVCREEHWSTPHVRTCVDCKKKQSMHGVYGL